MMLLEIVLLLGVLGLGAVSPQVARSGHVAGVLLGLIMMRIGVDALSYQTVGSRLGSPLVIGLAGCALALAVGARVVQSRALLWLIPVMALILVSFRTPGDGTLRHAAHVLVIPALAAALAHRASTVSLRRTLVAMAVVCLGLLVLFGAESASRFSVGDENPIWVARGLMLGAVAALSMRISIGLKIAVAGVFAYGAVLTGSRGPLWAFLVVLAIRGVIAGKGTWRFFSGSFLAVSVLFFVLEGQSRAIAELGLGRESSLDARSSLAQEGLTVWRYGNIWWGSGRGADEAGSMLTGYPHNSAVEILAQAGVCGLVLYLVIAIAAWRAASAQLFRDLLVATLIFGLVSGSLWTNIETWVAVGMCFGSARRPLNNEEEPVLPGESTEDDASRHAQLGGYGVE